MSRRFGWLLMVVLLVGFLPSLRAQMDQDQSDPLTPDEVQQIRDSRRDPNERIKLYIKFLDQRVDALKVLIAGPRGKTWSAQVRDKLEEFTRLCDEMQDNLDMYDQAHADIRKSLKDLNQDMPKWSALLNGLPSDRGYEFSQKTALDSEQTAADEAKQIAEEQDIFFTAHKNLRHKTGNGPS